MGSFPQMTFHNIGPDDGCNLKQFSKAGEPEPELDSEPSNFLAAPAPIQL